MSAASIWELLINTNLGRMDLGGADLVAEISENGFFELPISARHAERAAKLPRDHDDPFDRMLAAQALGRGIDLGDPKSGVSTLRCADAVVEGREGGR